MALKVLVGLVSAGLIAVVAPAAAHHSVAGQFDVAKRTAISGTISKIDWINPHLYIHLDVTDEQGNVTPRRLESLPTAMLRKAGLTSAMLKGDGGPVTVEALPARNGTANLGWVQKITYADGHDYQLSGE